MEAVFQMLVVAGGADSALQLIASTEVFNYPTGTGWRHANPLPGPRSGGKGVSLAGVVHFVGGAVGFSRLSSILSWDPVSETWSEVGQLESARSFHAVAEIPESLVEEFCSEKTSSTLISD